MTGPSGQINGFDDEKIESVLQLQEYCLPPDIAVFVTVYNNMYATIELMRMRDRGEFPNDGRIRRMHELATDVQRLVRAFVANEYPVQLDDAISQLTDRGVFHPDEDYRERYDVDARKQHHDNDY